MIANGFSALSGNMPILIIQRCGSEMLINFPISVLLASSVGLRKSMYMSRIPFGAGYFVAFVLCT